MNLHKIVRAAKRELRLSHTRENVLRVTRARCGVLFTESERRLCVINVASIARTARHGSLSPKRPPRPCNSFQGQLPSLQTNTAETRNESGRHFTPTRFHGRDFIAKFSIRGCNMRLTDCNKDIINVPEMHSVRVPAFHTLDCKTRRLKNMCLLRIKASEGAPTAQRSPACTSHQRAR